ncbi:sugar-binding transcriptional regulator [Siculibacillus lacustris]|uniref:Sugar-binding transcriptional regulator n=1 Tax=Siculibacillus lacustris TaxID=1549641 RepID=A0A4Q9VEY7_9HYPH|nr:sugar-binding transcriptional regulator [Siculibacillus lacustris]TBW33282.1 sugar-binding transcriptional regulator [Siculibacillus lacustris]
MYYAEGMTQNAIADALGIGRVTVVRMLAEAKNLNEIKISLRGDLEEFPRLEIELEKAFGLKQAIVTPLSGPDADPTAPIGAACGLFISGLVKANMKVGVGWGRTLHGSLNYIDESQVPGVEVVSLMGGVSAVRQYNPAEFAWRFSRIFNADCYLIAAPVVVDSEATKTALVERCGIGPVFEMAKSLDVVLLSVGSMSPTSTSHVFDVISEAERQGLIADGAVGDVMYNFFDRFGHLVDNEMNSRIMSVSIAHLKQVPLKLLISGGKDKVEAVLGGLRLLEPNVLITDEITAQALLDEVADKSSRGRRKAIGA